MQYSGCSIGDGVLQAMTQHSDQAVLSQDMPAREYPENDTLAAITNPIKKKLQ
jgi:hypothetical protein